MATDLQIIRKYYEGWKDGNFDPAIFAENISFHGPLASAENLEEFKTLTKQMNEMVSVEGIEFKGLFADGYGNGCAVYDFITSAPVKMRTECAELFHFEDGKIKEIRLIYDAREWAKLMQQ